jgi:hypothetical protein
VAPGTSAAKVGTSARSDSWVEMIALSMEPGSCGSGYTISCGICRPRYEIGP